MRRWQRCDVWLSGFGCSGIASVESRFSFTAAMCLAVPACRGTLVLHSDLGLVVRMLAIQHMELSSLRACITLLVRPTLLKCLQRTLLSLP